jgi:hypothetical protein
MVINRDMREALEFSLGEEDEYGQATLDEENPITVHLTFGLYNHREVEDVRYQDVEYCGLTYDNITDNNVLLLDNKKYKVKFVNPYGRMKEVFLIAF